MSSQVCQGCNEAFGDLKLIACGCCSKIFHFTLKCLGVSPQELTALNVDSPVLLFYCSGCRESGGTKPTIIELLQNIRQDQIKFSTAITSMEEACNSVKELRNDVDDLRDKVIPEIRSDINVLKTQASTNTIWEIEQRMSRASNLIIKKLKDINRIEDDFHTINPILIDLDIHVTQNDFERLGKFDPSAHSNYPIYARPLLVKLKNAAEVNRAVANKDRFPDGTRIRRDQTRLQRDQLSGAHDELQSRTSTGELNLIIKFVDGIPRVIKANKTQKRPSPDNQRMEITEIADSESQATKKPKN